MLSWLLAAFGRWNRCEECGEYVKPETFESWLPVVTGYLLLTLLVYVVIVAPALGVHLDPALVAAVFTLWGGSKATIAWKAKTKIERDNQVQIEAPTLPPTLKP